MKNKQSALTKRKIEEVCDGNTDTEVELDMWDCTYHVPLYSQLALLDLAYSPLWTRVFREWDDMFKDEVSLSIEKFFEHTQGMGRDRAGRVLTNDFNAFITGQDDSTRHFCESDYLTYCVFQNKSQLRGDWILIINAGEKTQAFYCEHGEDVISTLQAALVLTCDTCNCIVENYTTNYEFPWSEDLIIYQEEHESLCPDYAERSPDQQLLPGMPEPISDLPAPKWRIDPEELAYYDAEQEDYLLFIEGKGPICQRCWHGVLS